jgi:hypothetical protein
VSRRLLAALLALALLSLCAATATASAAAADEPPAPEVTEAAAIAAADRDSKVLEQRRENGDLTADAETNDDGVWEVRYFADDDDVALVLVDPKSGEVSESWTGYQVNWKMARGYSGSFGHKLNAPYVFIPLCLIFILGLFDWRRPWRLANLDLVVLLGFGVSHFFFNRAEIGVSVPLQYPVLLYLLGRALWVGCRGRGEGLRPIWPATWLLIAALFLIGVRVGLNMADSGAIDVGYAGVVGADKVTHGEALYDNFPDGISTGDTYGPINYFSYVPYELIWPNDGEWDDLPAAHGAAISFDILTFGFLILLGLRIRPGPAGRRLAAILAFGWAAYPYSAYALESNSNDSLVALLLVATLLVLAKPLARGATLALATWAKFTPAILAPMLLTYRPRAEGEADRRPVWRRLLDRPALLFLAGFALVTVFALAWPALEAGGLRTAYERTIATQSGRDSPFSIWGQVDWLNPLRTAILAATAALSLLLAFRPRDKSLLQVAALGAALIICLQLTLQHWFYLYIVWFYPLLLVALALLESPRQSPGPEEPEPSPARRSQPVPAR